MYKRSVRRAYFGISPHLWPFHAYWLLVRVIPAAVAIWLAYAFVLGVVPFSPGGLVFVVVYTALAVALIGVLPAALLSLLDLLLVDRPERRPAKFDSKRHHTGHQSYAIWAASGAAVGALFAIAYGYVYLNAFAIQSDLMQLLETSLLRSTVGGAGAGALAAVGVNRLSGARLNASALQYQHRAAAVWAAAVIALSTHIHFGVDPTIERTFLPGALLAVIGAIVVPQLATTPPADVALIPPPRFPTAPSPDPLDPEGGSGEGAEGAWRNAPPPPGNQVRKTRSDAGSIPNNERTFGWTTP